MFEGDIVYDNALREEITMMMDGVITQQDAINNGAWPKGVIPYSFSSSFPYCKFQQILFPNSTFAEFSGIHQVKPKMLFGDSFLVEEFQFILFSSTTTTTTMKTSKVFDNRT